MLEKNMRPASKVSDDFEEGVVVSRHDFIRRWRVEGCKSLGVVRHG